MSKPRYRWWGYVRNVVRAYPMLVKELADLREMNVVASASGMPRGGGSGDPVAVAATRELPAQEQKEHDAVEAAIRETRTMINGRERMTIIRLVYWDGTHTVDEAGLVAGYEKTQTRKLHQEFILLVAENLGLLAKSGPESQKDVV